MYVLASKLKILKANLKVWNHTFFGNWYDKVVQDEHDLASI